MVLADPTQMHQILVNLCTNASHAMRDDGGRLEVSLTDVDLDCETRVGDELLEPGRYVRLSVADSGCGMSEDVVSRIFEPFFTTKNVNEGTGLGLSVVHGIIKSHDGAIGCVKHVNADPDGQRRELGLVAGLVKYPLRRREAEQASAQNVVGPHCLGHAQEGRARIGRGRSNS